jgi:hypothetical protein
MAEFNYPVVTVAELRIQGIAYGAPRLIHILLRIAAVEQHFQLLFVCNKAIFRGALR